MAIVRTDDRHYKNIANTLRSISGDSDLYTPEQLPSAITKGINDAHGAGINVGYNEGYGVGYGVGEEQGYNIGFSEGYDEGETDGKQEAYDAFWDSFQQNGERRIYHNAFSGSGWNSDILKPKYPIIANSESNSCNGMFQNCNFANDTPIDMTEICEKLDLTECVNATNMFSNVHMKNITVDLSNVTNMTNCFNQSNGGRIKDIYLKVSEKCTTFTSAFAYMGNKIEGGYCETLIFLEGSVIAANGLVFNKWNYLNKESITSIINALSPTTTKLTITLSKVSVNKAFETSKGASDGSTSSEWASLIATKSNWTISLG